MLPYRQFVSGFGQRRGASLYEMRTWLDCWGASLSDAGDKAIATWMAPEALRLSTVDPITPGLLDREYVARELVPFGSPESAALLTATANDGSYLDATSNKGGRTYTYQVCETGSTSACSPVQSITF